MSCKCNNEQLEELVSDKNNSKGLSLLSEYFFFTLEQTPTKSDKGEALLYISKEINYKTRNDLNIYIEKLLESIFIEVYSESNKSTVVGCVYKHPGLTTQSFNFDYLQPLIDKLSIENKNIIFLGDFNVDVSHYKSNNPTREFLDLMFSASLTPQITITTHLTVRSRTLIDNIFTNSVEENSTSGNLECCISDHLAQFLIFPNQRVLQQNKHTKYERSYKNLDTSKFKNELQRIDWTTALSINNNGVNRSLKNFLNISSSPLDKYAPLKQMNNNG